MWIKFCQVSIAEYEILQRRTEDGNCGIKISLIITSTNHYYFFGQLHIKIMFEEVNQRLDRFFYKTYFAFNIHEIVLKDHLS